MLNPLVCVTEKNLNKVENSTRIGVYFLTNFEVFGNVVKHCRERLTNIVGKYS